MKKFNQYRQNYDGESYVIAFKLMVPRRGRKLLDGHLTKGGLYEGGLYSWGGGHVILE